MARILSIVAPEQFQHIEYLESKRALEEAGHRVFMASVVLKPTDKMGQTHRADLLVSDVNPNDYDAVLFVGGPGVYAYFDDPVILGMARSFFEAGKLTTAICAAPTILARAGLLNGKTATCFPSESKEIEKGGGIYSRNHVEEDGLLITGDGPASSHAFGKKIAEALSKI